MRDKSRPWRRRLYLFLGVQSAGVAFSQAEKHHFASVRLSLQGTREVLLTPERVFFEFFSQKAGTSAVAFSDLWAAFKELSPEDMQLYLARGGGEQVTWHCTVSEGDVLIVLWAPHVLL